MFTAIKLHKILCTILIVTENKATAIVNTTAIPPGSLPGLI